MPESSFCRHVIQVYCNHMIVGRAESQFSAAVSFYNDKVVYAFQHARERRIDMIMYYKVTPLVSLHLST